MSWTNEEKENVISLLLSRDEASIILGLELLKQRQDVDVFGMVLYFVKVVGSFENMSIYNDLESLLDHYTDPAVVKLAEESLKLVEYLWSLDKDEFLAALENYEKIVGVYESYIALAPFYGKYYSEIGKRLINFRKKLMGYHYIEKATELMPDDAEAHSDAAYHYREAKKYHKRIIYHYERCLALGKRSIMIYHNLGRAYAYLGNQPEKAKKVLKDGLQLYPNCAETWTELAYIEEDFDYLKAKEYLETALQIEPDSALANNNMAFLLWDKMQAFEEAKEYVLKAVKIEAEEGLYWHTLAEIEWYGFQNKKAAVSALEKAKEVEPKYKGADEMLEKLSS